MDAAQIGPAVARTEADSSAVSRKRRRPAVGAPVAKGLRIGETPPQGTVNTPPAPVSSSGPQKDCAVVLSPARKVSSSTSTQDEDGATSGAATTLDVRNGIQPTRESSLFFNKTRLLGRSHWAHGLAQFADILDTRCNIFYGESAEFARLLGDCKTTARKLKTKRHVMGWTHARLLEHVPERNICDSLIELYIRTFETVFRVIHVPTFMEEYERHWLEPEQTTDMFLVMLLLVLAIGTSFHDDTDSPDLHALATDWIDTSKSWVEDGLLDKHRLSLRGIQTQCLLLVSFQTNAGGGDLTWLAAAPLLQSAILIGLHRDPVHLPEMPLLQAEMRRRLWATILELITQSSIATGMPSLISPKDYDSQAPSNIDDNQLNRNGILDIQVQSSDVYTDCSIQRALVASLPLRMKIVDKLNGLHADLNYDDILAIGEELMKHCRNNSKFFRGLAKRPFATRTMPTLFAVNTLDTLTRRFLLSIHAPFARESKTNLAYHYSRTLGLECALLLMASNANDTAISLRCPEDCRNFDKYSRGIFRSITMETYATLCGELIDHVQNDTAPGTDLITHSNLYEAVKNARDSALARIQAGDTGVKTYIFLASVWAKVEALQAGSTVQTAIYVAAKDGLERSHEILKQRLEKLGRSTSSAVTPNNGLDSSLWPAADVFGFDWSVDSDMSNNWLFSSWTNDILPYADPL